MYRVDPQLAAENVRVDKAISEFIKSSSELKRGSSRGEILEGLHIKFHSMSRPSRSPNEGLIYGWTKLSTTVVAEIVHNEQVVIDTMNGNFSFSLCVHKFAGYSIYRILQPLEECEARRSAWEHGSPCFSQFFFMFS